MTLNEAKKLKAGDRVLVEAIIRDHAEGIIDRKGNVRITNEIADDETTDWSFTKPESIREKIAPPRRKFRDGDIVCYAGSGALAYVCRDELEDGSVFVGGLTKSIGYIFLKLVCPVEERHDRKEEK